MSSLQIVVNAEETQAKLIQDLVMDTTKTREAALALSQYFRNVASGSSTAVVDVHTGSAAPVAASGTFTLVSVPADDTVVIGGVTLTAKASPAGEAQWSQAGSDTVDAASLATVINAHSTLSQVVTATSAAGVVTVTAKVKGVVGNVITISETGSSITASGTALTGGTGGATDSATTYVLGM
jgi:phage tail sheath gpL-like